MEASTQNKSINKIGLVARDLNDQGKRELELSLRNTAFLGLGLIFGSFVGAGYISSNLASLGLAKYASYRKTSFIGSFLLLSFASNGPLSLYQKNRQRAINNNPVFKRK